MQKISENDMYVYADNIPGFNMQSILEFGMYVSVPDYMPSVHQFFVAPFDRDLRPPPATDPPRVLASCLAPFFLFGILLAS